MALDGFVPLLFDLVVTVPDIILLLPNQPFKELGKRDHGLDLAVYCQDRVILKSIRELDRLNHRVVVEFGHECFAFLLACTCLLIEESIPYLFVPNEKSIRCFVTNIAIMNARLNPSMRVWHLWVAKMPLEYELIATRGAESRHFDPLLQLVLGICLPLLESSSQEVFILLRLFRMEDIFDLLFVYVSYLPPERDPIVVELLISLQTHNSESFPQLDSVIIKQLHIADVD